MDFNRMKKITTDMDLVANALSDSEMLQLSEDKKSVRRVVPLPENDDSKDRTIYVKRINKSASLDDIIAFFEKHAQVNAVRMRHFVARDSDKKEKSFKGSAFVEFKTKEDADKVMKMEGDLKWDDKTDPLIFYWKKDYHKQKNEERRQQKRARDQEEKVHAEDQFKKNFKGCVVKIENIGDKKEGDNFSFVTIKDEMRKLSGQKQVHVEYPAGNDNTAFVRMIDRKGANTAVANAKNRKVILRGNEVALSVLDGEEEDKVLGALAKAFFDIRSEREARRSAKRQKTSEGETQDEKKEEA
eukprot:CAMPEP_0117443762 /NCGR_PEP_ID=MMETSP0759-20121206/4872_1 /TAXON_ID=63605 /ORGANISM="Percolomonas cosmopolitus, Strain WS" /LENGTH=298 /DNA_ID=CAMNT_0005235767 /DNA_START=205 /DNA_END=1101 /DNA_ORIENTATION=+